MYKQFNVTDLKACETRSGTQGYQPKYYVDNYFIKQQARIDGILMNDWQVEIFASKLCELLNIKSVIQKPCKIIKGINTYMGVYSENFEKKGVHFVPFKYLLDRNKDDIRNYAFNSLSALDKLSLCCNIMSKYSGINYFELEAYMLKTALIDILVCNVDRHIKNFGVMKTVNGYTVAPIFDNGMGFFESISNKSMYSSLDEIMREAYISPYGEDPFDMLKLLKCKYNLISYLNKHTLNQSLKWTFPNKYAKQYYFRILREIEG